MKSSLIPERPILIYPSLAATIGLDESVMLSTLSEAVMTKEGAWSNGFTWYSLPLNQLSESLPFWDPRDLQRVSTSLREKGVVIIASASFSADDLFKFAFNEKSARATLSQNVKQSHKPTPVATGSQPTYSVRNQGQAAASRNYGEQGKNFIPANWQPDQTTLEQLAQLTIPREFALQQLPEFVTYWRERGEAHRSWGQKFINHTLQRWRAFEVQEHRKSKATPIYSNWHPSEVCLADLTEKRIPKTFMLDQVREFISFWQATEEQHISWDAKFLQRVSSLWAEQEAKKNVSAHKAQILSSWRPSLDAMEVMTTKSGIPQSFIEDAIAEFIIYWKDKGTATTTWNSLFIKHVRLQWHRFQHSLDNNVDPQPIHTEWQPSADAFDILQMANIDAEFAKMLVPEFILYWRDTNQIHSSWNTRFIRHCKKMWAQRHLLADTSSPDNKSTRDVSLEEILTDRSWAE
ncbi:MAG: hypothetical protein ACI9Y1_002383 [Lentisphaeria bacterium]|jgi:hypothetical protein